MAFGTWLGGNSWLRKALRILSVFAVLVGVPALLGGCGTTQMGAYGSGMNSIAIVQNPDINGGKLSPKAVAKIDKLNASCRKQIGAQIAGPVQSGINGVVPYGVAGAGGVGLGASEAFAGAPFGAYAMYGGIATAASGGVNGLITGAYAMASAVGTCTRDFWSEVVHTDPVFAGAWVEVVYAGKAWGNSSPPALVQPANDNVPSAANDNAPAQQPYAAAATGSTGASPVTIVPLPSKSSLPKH